jgi:thiamine biosynthesis protein ThiS
MITIRLNGEPRTLAAQTSIQGLVQTLDLQGKRFAVELNKDIVPKAHHQQVLLQDGDEVEVVQAIGGG